MKVLKNIFIVVFILFTLFCLVINGWWFYVSYFTEEKATSNTFEVGLQQTTDGTTKYFMEVNSYDNCFEVKFNYMLDETQTAFYSQGLQFYNEFDNVYFNEYTKIKETNYDINFWGWTFYDYDYKNVLIANVGNTERYNYMSGNDYAYTQISTNPIGEDTYFKVQFDKGETKEVYLMSFKGDIYLETKEYDSWWNTDYCSYYDVYDVDRLCGLLFLGIQSMPYGTNCSTIFEFGDLFNYYEPDSTSSFGYKLVDSNKSSAIIEDIKSYYSIKITKNEGKIQTASQSLFNCVDGSPNYNVSSLNSLDYFYGRTLISVTNDMFTPVLIAGNSIALKLNEDFVKLHLPYVNKIYLEVLIDLDFYNNQGYKVLGFTTDNGLNQFEVKSCLSVETINNELVYSEVAYVK